MRRLPAKSPARVFAHADAHADEEAETVFAVLGTSTGHGSGEPPEVVRLVSVLARRRTAGSGTCRRAPA